MFRGVYLSRYYYKAVRWNFASVRFGNYVAIWLLLKTLRGHHDRVSLSRWVISAISCSDWYIWYMAWVKR